MRVRVLWRHNAGQNLSSSQNVSGLSTTTNLFVLNIYTQVKLISEKLRISFAQTNHEVGRLPSFKHDIYKSWKLAGSCTMHNLDIKRSIKRAFTINYNTLLRY